VKSIYPLYATDIQIVAPQLPHLSVAEATRYYPLATGFTPFQLVYGMNARMPIELEVKTLRTASQLGMNLTEAQEERLTTLQALDEFRRAASQNSLLISEQRRRWHDRTIRKTTFSPGKWALVYDSKFGYFSGKFKTRWLGPYEILEVFDNGTVKLKAFGDERKDVVINGFRLRLYNPALSKEEWIERLGVPSPSLISEPEL